MLRPAKLWCDVEAAAEAAELSVAHKRTIVPSFTGAKLLWLKRHGGCRVCGCRSSGIEALRWEQACWGGFTSSLLWCKR